MPTADTEGSIRIKGDVGRSTSRSIVRTAVFDQLVMGNHEQSLETDQESAVEPSEKEYLFLDAIARASGGGLRHVSLKICDGVLVLRGTVTSFYFKQLAQETVRPLAIGLRIDNRIVVD